MLHSMRLSFVNLLGPLAFVIELIDFGAFLCGSLCSVGVDVSRMPVLKCLLGPAVNSEVCIGCEHTVFTAM